MCKTLIITSLVLTAMLSFTANAAQIIQYTGTPITIELTIGEERSINFGAHVQVGTTPSQKQRNLFRLQTAQGYIHIKANREFESERIQVKRLDNGTLMLIDLSARRIRGFEEEVRIITPDQNKVSVNALASDVAKLGGAGHITPVELTRYAAKKLFAPTRLDKPVAGITAAPLGVKGEIKLFKGLNRKYVSATPLFAIQGGGYFLTAIHLQNKAPHRVTLSYLDINLPFTHATFQHHTLQHMGLAGEDTALYLVSDKPISQTLIPWDYFAPHAQTVTKESP